ncbi:prolyl oligopeptidase family serine peptidase [Nannocystis pusilla]|uniref:carboxylesterase family protein n=1 Tax=Nannocystis pusilla TaxID=889268 RepID=UPI003B7D51EB
MPSSAHFKKIPLGMSEAAQGYWEYTPPGYGGGEKYPLMIFLHGIGENGNGDSELDKVPNGGPPKLQKNNQWDTTLPFVVLSPQHPGGGCPGSGEVHSFIEYAMTHYDINPARVYLTGLSCGAIGSWGYLGDFLDEQIAAMVPIAGDGKGAFMKAKCELGRVPIWAFHGDQDPTVNVSGTVEPVTNLQMCDPKPDVEMVIYPGVGHDSWSKTYDLSAGHDIYSWMLERYKQ